MKVFHCDHCGQPVFFENIRCVACNHVLAYLTDLGEIGSLEPIDETHWQSPLQSGHAHYRLCRNYTEFQICNWTLNDDDGAEGLCRSCRLTKTIPDVSPQGHREAWYKLEVAKRRLLYTLFRLGLPVVEKSIKPASGLAFEFLADPIDPAAPRVLTGHDNGVIRINIAEADDGRREQRRHQLHEPYRTLLGHFRHEIGHYYWDRLVKDSAGLDEFRQRFGDERRDYAEALQDHYQQGPPSNWQEHFVSAYGSAHPWEDWAETWAHYLHMADTLETAAACGLVLRPAHRDEPTLLKIAIAEKDGSASFDRMVRSWFPVTYVLNNLNRGMGLPDGYPFVLSPDAIEKLHFVHDVIAPYATAA